MAGRTEVVVDGRRRGARLLASVGLDSGWAARAGCRGTDREMFFAVGRGAGDLVARALALCAGCPVREACLRHAETAPERFGIWGGTTAAQRGWNSLGKPLTPQTSAPPSAA